jgi:hypothetical protein
MRKQDPYCYPETSVLKNKFNIREVSLLEKAEADLSRAKMSILYESPYTQHINKFFNPPNIVTTNYIIRQPYFFDNQNVTLPQIPITMRTEQAKAHASHALPPACVSFTT